MSLGRNGVRKIKRPGRRDVESALKPPSRRWRMVRVTVLCAAIIAACIGLDRNDSVFDYLEQQSFILRMSSWARFNVDTIQNIHKQIVLAPITDETFADPAFRKVSNGIVPRSYHARVLHELREAGAKVIAFDLLFDFSRPQDSEFAASVKKYGGVVWGCAWDSVTQKMLMPNQRLLAASPYFGHVRWPHSEPNPVANRLEVAVRADREVIPAFSVEIARMALGLESEPLEQRERSWKCGNMLIPTDRDGTFHINFFGTPDETGTLSDAFAPVPFEQIYNGATHDPFYRDRRFFHNKIVIIGDIRDINSDFVKTPVGQMAGLEVHAHAVATLLERSFLHEPPDWFGVLFTALLAATTSWLAVSRRWLSSVGITALLLAGYFVAAIWLFVSGGLVLPVAVPALTAIATSLATIAERGWTEERERARITVVLQQYVSEQVSEHGAPTGEVALLFTDLEGSTVLSRRFGERFERVRDEHFRIMRGAARLWNGFEVETAGDSLYLVFARASDAVRFAIDAQRDLLNHPWPPVVGNVRVRMGIHFGQPFVGRDRARLTYRGPDTNRTARVMGAAAGGQVLVTKALVTAAGDELPMNITFLDRGEFALKGIGDETLYQLCHPDLPREFGGE